MSDEVLYKTVIEALTVVDAESGERYRSKRRAEYLERLLFVCPVCGKVSTLRSEGERVHCTACGLSVTYGEDLLVSSEHPRFAFRTLKQWYDFQCAYLRDYEVKAGEVIYRDEGAVLYDKTTEKRITVAEGACVLSDTDLAVGEMKLPLSEIRSVSVVGGRKLVFHTADRFYILTGDERFNAIKYALTFNILPTQIGNEKYYGL